MGAAAAGFGLGLSLIVAIGAQNAYVLRQGLLRSHVLPVVLVCAVSDAVLIVAGVAGAGALVSSAPGLLEVVRWVGAAFLLGYAVVAARRALRPAALRPADGGSVSLGAAVTTAAAFTWLNPHVYLDTVVLVGSVGATYGSARWVFALDSLASSSASARSGVTSATLPSSTTAAAPSSRCTAARGEASRLRWCTVTLLPPKNSASSAHTPSTGTTWGRPSGRTDANQ